MNLKEATKIVALLQTMWGNATWHAKANVAYQMALDDLEYEDVEQAVRIAFKTCKFAPTPVELRELIGHGVEDEWSAELPTGKQAWEEIRAQMRYPGSWGKPKYSHPLIARTSKAFGWTDLCAVLESDMNTLRAQVERFHDGYRADAIAALKRGVPMDRAILPHGEQHRIAGLALAEIEAGAA